MDDKFQDSGVVPPYKDQDREPQAARTGPGGQLVLSQEQQQMLLRMAEVGCSVREMCTILGVVRDRDTLVRHYGELIDFGRMNGNQRLRRVQFEKAIEGDVKMLIFLGKQRLGQTEEGHARQDEPLPWNSGESDASEES